MGSFTIGFFYDAQVPQPPKSRVRVRLDSRIPVFAALAPIGLAEFVGDFDRPDPFGVLVAELGRSAQPQRIAERIADDLAGIFGGEDRLWMQRGLVALFFVAAAVSNRRARRRRP